MLPTIALGLGAAAAGYFGAKEQADAQRDANQQNIASAKEQMAFQERMSNTAYQRSMNDMKTAGLNPMLAFSQGGASSPSGAAAQVQALPSKIQNVSKGALEGISAASQIASIRNQNISTESTAKLQTAQAANTAAQTRKTQLDAIKTEADTKKILQEFDQSANTFKDRKELLRIEAKMRSLDSDWQQAEKVISAGEGVTGAIGNLINPFKGFLNKTSTGSSAKQPPEYDYDRTKFKALKNSLKQNKQIKGD